MIMPKTAAQIGREILAGKIDPVELAESVFDKTEASSISDTVFCALTKTRALKEAEACRKRQKSGELLSPLDGVPVSWKDLFDSKDIVTEAGSKLLKGRMPQADCEVLKRGTSAGMICIGKTHMSELAFSGLGINPNAATPPNIHGDKLAPGGSSSGAAASVAHGFVPLGIGSDTGGSVRIPSAWNDLVGLKTTAGLIPNKGVVPLCKGFDTVGPLCTSVEDACLSTHILAGLPPVLPEAKPLSKCRFLINKTIQSDDLGEDQEKGFEQAVSALGKAGATIEEAELELFHDLVPLGPVLFPHEAWQEWGAIIEKKPELMFEPVRNRFLAGKSVTKNAYEEAWQKMIGLRKRYEKETADYDAVLAPTVCIGPPMVHELLNDTKRFQATNLDALRNTRFGNMLGLCALTLPTSRPASGIMFMGKPFGETELVTIGLSAETVVKQ